jgi:hypothetical protein
VVAAACLFVASKLEDVSFLSVEDLVDALPPNIGRPPTSPSPHDIDLLTAIAVITAATSSYAVITATAITIPATSIAALSTAPATITVTTAVTTATTAVLGCMGG